ncbi:MAG TPA: hypothetical protein VFY23_11175 [Candidatus Limnocylindrales bacterium]|nr:hypothetical protein [Candidatus Limnocylindrales bacterium]
MDPVTGGAVVHEVAAHRSAHADRASAIYGSLLVLSLIAAQGRGDVLPEFIAATIAVGVGVFWLMEVWTELLGLRTLGPVSRRSVVALAAAETPMLASAILPMLVLFTASLGILAPEDAINLAMAVGIGQLLAWGLVVGHALGRGWGPAIVVALVDGALGLLIVALKVLVLH